MFIIAAFPNRVNYNCRDRFLNSIKDTRQAINLYLDLHVFHISAIRRGFYLTNFAMRRGSPLETREYSHIEAYPTTGMGRCEPDAFEVWRKRLILLIFLD